MKYTTEQLRRLCSRVRCQLRSGTSGLTIHQIKRFDRVFGRGAAYATYVMSYEQASAAVRAAGITCMGFRTWKRPEGVPSNPPRVYAGKGWTNWSDFCGTKREFLAYKDAKQLVREKGITCGREFRAWDKPACLPKNPQHHYRNAGWEGWDTFLGKEDWLPYHKARNITRKAGITGRRDFCNWKKPMGVPSSPGITYEGRGWVSWSDFLGTTNKIGGFLSFEAARVVARRMGAASVTQYRKMRRPKGMPGHPYQHYQGKGWTDWPDFLGIKRRVN